jgi:hypothetical protein
MELSNRAPIRQARDFHEAANKVVDTADGQFARARCNTLIFRDNAMTMR